MAGWTGLEPAAFCVTGRRSNQLSYHPSMGKNGQFPDDIKIGQEVIPSLFLPSLTPDFPDMLHSQRILPRKGS